MKATMRISVRNGVEIPAEGIMLDAFGLAAIFGTLQEMPDSRVYSFEGVRFWRANQSFVIAYRDETFMVDYAIGLEAFHALLLEQKAS